MIPIEIKPLPKEDLKKIYTIDRSEEIDRMYRQVGEDLEVYERSISVQRDDSFWDTFYDKWITSMENGAEALGAVDDGKLAGFTIVRYDLEPNLAQILALYVSAEYRLSGIAKSLFLEAQDAAARRDAKSIYVSATPTHSAVNFYLSQGFVPTAKPDPDLLEKEPEDIHMIKSL